MPLTLKLLNAMLQTEKRKRDQQVLELQKRVLKLERDLIAARKAHADGIARTYVEYLKQFLEEERARSLYPLIRRETADIERRLREELKPHMVRVDVHYSGPQEDGTEHVV